MYIVSVTLAVVLRSSGKYLYPWQIEREGGGGGVLKKYTFLQGGGETQFLII